MEINKPGLQMNMDEGLAEVEPEEVTLEDVLVRQYNTIQAIEWKLDVVLAVLGGIAEVTGMEDVYTQLQTVIHTSYEKRNTPCTCETCKEKQEGDMPNGQTSNSYYPE